MVERADRLIVQFAREPRLGEVKTRMQPELSIDQSMVLHEALVEHICLGLMATRMAAVKLWVAGCVDHPLFLKLTDTGLAGVCRQQGADLGARMASALNCELGYYQKVVLVGSDCVHLDRDYLELAFAALDSCPMVFGPAEDGGYVLVGATRVVPEVFTGMEWGGTSVMQHTRERLEMVGVRWLELDLRSDIDRPGDLKLLEGVLNEIWEI